MYLLPRYLELWILMEHCTVLKLPSWLPGARFKRYAREWYPIVVRAVKTPFEKVKRELVSVAGSPLITISKTRLFRRPERQLPLSLQRPYRNLMGIQPRKTYGSPRLSLEHFIWPALTR